MTHFIAIRIHLYKYGGITAIIIFYSPPHIVSFFLLRSTRVHQFSALLLLAQPIFSFDADFFSHLFSLPLPISFHRINISGFLFITHVPVGRPQEIDRSDVAE